MFINRSIVCLALCTVLLCTGCASAEGKSSSAAESSSKAESSAPVSEASKDTDSTPEKEIPKEEPGPLLAKAAELFTGGTYSFECTLTDSEGNVTEISRQVTPSGYYQLQKNAIGECGSVMADGKSYMFDKVSKMYAEDSVTQLESTVAEVAGQMLPHTSTHINKLDQQEYDIEEYTYTGETYITVFDFYFSKSDGKLVKYITTYSVEGSDDIVETREFTKLSNQADSSLVSLSVLANLTDFDELTQEECQEEFERICDANEVSDSDMAACGTSRDALGKLSFYEFEEMLYSCGFDSIYEQTREAAESKAEV